MEIKQPSSLPPAWTPGITPGGGLLDRAEEGNQPEEHPGESVEIGGRPRDCSDVPLLWKMGINSTRNGAQATNPGRQAFNALEVQRDAACAMVPAPLGAAISMAASPGVPAVPCQENKISGINTVSTVSALYDAAGPRIGCLLVEPQAVLTLSGARGSCDILIGKPDIRDLDRLNQLKGAFKHYGMVLDYSEADFKNGNDPASIIITNFQGCERVTKSTHLPGIPQYVSGSGQEGLEQWREKAFLGLKAEREKATIPESSPIEDMITGVQLGYPDQAVLDFAGCVGNERWRETMPVPMKYGRYYDGPCPQFTILEKHIDMPDSRKQKITPSDIIHPDIRQRVEEWDSILKDFYDSPWHRSQSSDPVFINERKKKIQMTREFCERKFGALPYAPPSEEEKRMENRYGQ